jgi:hypothetical protein
VAGSATKSKKLSAFRLTPRLTAELWEVGYSVQGWPFRLLSSTRTELPLLPSLHKCHMFRADQPWIDWRACSTC